ncbi:ATP-binding protein [Pseudohongiella spirulinae]|uniref:histidine kinase n=1 Tax=Pseudohongiella spirulinae TaxID=1249552 RepID=A0A0S2KBK6_9GAMM|nr:ATP-binding protein [Pseudohongiella spirulinae]ALO45708.1 hypothetical protein PS2015_1043 [Pseudohongiella spirulinae]
MSDIPDRFSSLFTSANGELRSSPRTGLQRLLMLRALVAVSGTTGALAFDFFSPLNLPVLIVALLLTGIAISLIAGWLQVTRATLVSQNALIINLALDFLFLVVLLVYTGGAANPLISYLLVLLAVAATLLSAMWAILFAVLAMIIYTVFLFIGISTDAHGDHMMQSFQLHLVGMWVTFVVSAALISVFVSRMATAIRIRETSLAQFRESEMRNEQLVAIGTLAAGTAHALGTPLSTMSVLLTELDEQPTHELSPDDLKADIHLLRQQVNRCKDSLDQLTRIYHQNDQQHRGLMRVSNFQGAIRDYITNIHPNARISFEHDKTLHQQLVSGDITVRHALINIIENAIRAAHSEVRVHYSVNEQMLLISVEDDGPGIPAHIMESMGEPFISTREGNMGLGIYLANASIQRHGGTIEMVNLKDGGARSLIQLPLTIPVQSSGNKNTRSTES